MALAIHETGVCCSFGLVIVGRDLKWPWGFQLKYCQMKPMRFSSYALYPTQQNLEDFLYDWKS